VLVVEVEEAELPVQEALVEVVLEQMLQQRQEQQIQEEEAVVQMIPLQVRLAVLVLLF
jgi:hypothetical protein